MASRYSCGGWGTQELSGAGRGANLSPWGAQAGEVKVSEHRELAWTKEPTTANLTQVDQDEPGQALRRPAPTSQVGSVPSGASLVV